MVKNAEDLKTKYLSLNQASGPVFKIRDDPRYTKLGKFLSHTGLDELPQLVNILKGNMSLVGPRPLPISEEIRITDQYQTIRRSVKPGFTSSWLLNGSHKISFTKWMELDIEDIQKSELIYDLTVLMKTFLLAIKMFLTELYTAAKTLTIK